MPKMEWAKFGMCQFKTGRGAAWLARLLGVQEVPGSNPGSPTKFLKDLHTPDLPSPGLLRPTGVQKMRAFQPIPDDGEHWRFVGPAEVFDKVL